MNNKIILAIPYVLALVTFAGVYIFLAMLAGPWVGGIVGFIGGLIAAPIVAIVSDRFLEGMMNSYD